MGKQLNVENSVISAKDDALFYNAMIQKNGVWQYGNKLDYEIISANQINIKDGMVTAQGRNYVIYPNEVDSMTIENGTVNTKRYDLIVYEVSKTSEGEQVGLKVIKGTSATTPTDPILIQENTLVSGSKYQMPLYRVRLNGINVDGVDDLREYIVSFGNVSNQNLLINGDFQCNQRGQSEYISMLDSTVLTLDMWLVNANSNLKVNKLENGVKLTCTSVTANSLFYERVDFELLEKTYTVQAKIDGVIYAHTFKNIQIENKHDLGNGVSLWVSSAEEYQIFGILFTQSKTINVEYLDVFEGDIAYPHVKEDKDIALTRCQDYIRQYDNMIFNITYTYSNKKFIVEANYPKMKKIPTFAHGACEMWSYDGELININIESQSLTSTILTMRTAEASKEKKDGSYIIFVKNVVLSCEPL